jgi:hypothetical protein
MPFLAFVILLHSLVFLAYYTYRGVSGSLAFRAKHPWLGYRNLLSIFIMDHLYQVINFYVILTLGAEGWMTRNDSPNCK